MEKKRTTKKVPKEAVEANNFQPSDSLYRITFDIKDHGNEGAKVRKALYKEVGKNKWAPCSLAECDSISLLLTWVKLDMLARHDDDDKPGMGDQILFWVALLIMDKLMFLIKDEAENGLDFPTTTKGMIELLEARTDLFVKAIDDVLANPEKEPVSFPMVQQALKYFRYNCDVDLWMATVIKASENEYGKKIMSDLSWGIRAMGLAPDGEDSAPEPGKNTISVPHIEGFYTPQHLKNRAVMGTTGTFESEPPVKPKRKRTKKGAAHD